jgi:hypothetical protein
MKFVVLIFLLFFSSQIFGKELNILFIGNSYTYRNHMPKLFEKIAHLNGKKVNVYTNTKGRTSFYGHSMRQKMFKAIAWKKWDLVVLQGSSRDMIKGEKTFKEKTIPGLEKILSSIKNNHRLTKVFFFMTWAYQKGFGKMSYDDMTLNVKKGYEGLSEKYNIPVVPVGLAWREIVQKYQKTKLYQPDEAHPSLKGSYLTASCFYVSIFKEKPKKHLSLFNEKLQQKLEETSFKIVKDYDYSPLNIQN